MAMENAENSGPDDVAATIDQHTRDAMRALLRLDGTAVTRIRASAPHGRRPPGQHGPAVDVGEDG